MEVLGAGGFYREMIDTGGGGDICTPAYFRPHHIAPYPPPTFCCISQQLSYDFKSVG